MTGVSDATKRQVFLMSAGIVLHNLILLVICLIWFRNLSNILGVFLGAVAAVLLLSSMAYSTELCVEAADEEYARRKMTIHAILRSVAILAAVAVLWKFTQINILTVVLGILGLKTGAYLYPVMKKFFDHTADG